MGLWILGVGSCMCVKAQEITGDTAVLKKRVYKLSFITTEAKKITGYLAGLSDSNLYLSPSPLYFSLNKRSNYLSSYPYDRLEKIEIRRKGAARRGAWQGALIGLATGVIIGLASGDDPVVPLYNNPNDPFGNALGNLFVATSNAFAMTAGEKAVVGGLAGTVTGGLIGALLGSLVKKKFIIGRNKERFRAMKRNIMEKLQVK